MILGLGNDLIDIRRIERTMERYGDRFLERMFTEIERRKSEGRRHARGFLRQTVRRQGGLLQGARHRLRRGVYWRDMGVVNLPSGRPTLTLTGGAAKVLQD